MSHIRIDSRVGVLLGFTLLAARSSLVLRADQEDSPKPDVIAVACARAETYLREAKPREALDMLAKVFKDKDFKTSPERNQVLYLHGLAGFLLKDYLTAGRSLNQLVPFDDPVFGDHARYLLGRVHHLEDERAEAQTHYEGVLSAFEERKAKAAELLNDRESLQDRPDEKARLQAIVDAPLPEYLGRAGLYLGVLYYEAGRFLDARARFAEFVVRQAQSPLSGQARLFQGICEMQLQQYPDAIKSLKPLTEGKTEQAVTALWWTGKAQAASADPEDDEAVKKAVAQGLKTLRLAAARTEAIKAKSQRGNVSMDLADTLRQDGQFKEAADLYGRIVADHLLPGREEELLQLQVSALTLAGAYKDSNACAERFEKAYPRSLLLPEVLFRKAENASLLALAAGEAKERARLEAAAGQLFERVAENYPEYPSANLARYALALTLHHQGQWEKAQETLERIPPPECLGELVLAPYLLADCLIRQAPAQADDALAAGRLQEQLTVAAQLLTDFVANQPDHPQAPAALLRIGLCQQRLAALLSQAEERTQMQKAALATYERLLIEYPLSDLGPQAAFERARCLARLDKAMEAVNCLRLFASSPLVKQPIAPLALLQLSTLLRGQDGKAMDAAKVLGGYRQRHERDLLKDPAQASLVSLLRFHHGVALYEAGQFDLARSTFEALVQQAPTRPVAGEATLFIGQCLRDEGYQIIEKANQVLGTPDLKPATAESASQSLEEGRKLVRAALDYFVHQAAEIGKKSPAADLRARLLYQAVWSYRALAQEEVDEFRNKHREETRARLQEELAKKTPEGQPVPDVEVPNVPLAKVPWQPSEKKTLTLYQELTVQFPDWSLCNQVRLEWAELLAERGDWRTAVRLLKEALDREPPADMTERIRLRLGVCLQAQGDEKAALTQFEAVAANPESGFAGQAHYRAGDSLMRQGEWEAALKHLVPFRDVEALQNVQGLSDGALLRLSHVLAHLKKANESRQALEALFSRFPDSPWAAEAHYLEAWSWQEEQQYDKAAVAYALVTAVHKGQAEVGARAQLQLGICQVQQKKYAEALDSLLAVPDKYALPDMTALALLEDSHACQKLDKEDQAKQLLKQVIENFPKSPWSEIAQKRMEGTKETDAAPHALPAALALMKPQVKDILPLDRMGEAQPDRASLDDPSEALGHQITLAAMPSQRKTPAPWIRLSLPDPFENRHTIRLENMPEEGLLPTKGR